MAAISAPTIPARHEAFYQPMNLSLRLLSNSQTIMAAAQQSFGGFGAASPTPTPDLTFHLFEHTVDEAEPAPPRYRKDGDIIYQTTDGVSTLVADRQAGVAYGYFSKAVLANPVFFRWHFLELAFFVMLEPRGLMGVHGAALAKNGRAILLRAASGGGKTTLAYAGARQRFQALAEDVVWLDVKRNLWWGTPWSFHLLPDAKDLFPELAEHQPLLQINGERKLEVTLEQMRPGSTTVTAQPGAVVFVERAAGQASRLEAIDTATAKTIWLDSFAGAEMDFPNYHDHVNALLTNNAYRLQSGDDLESSLNLLETLFEG